jgi:hypothetical protein
METKNHHYSTEKMPMNFATFTFASHFHLPKGEYTFVEQLRLNNRVYE